MKHIAVTGSTGFVGSNLSIALAHMGYKVHALYRSDTKAKILDHPNITLYKGSLSDKASLRTVMENCEGLFHTAAYVQLWAKQSKTFSDTNIQGTQNVIEAAKEAGIKRGVFTSTAGVFGPSFHQAINEQHVNKLPFISAYEQSKHQADQFIEQANSESFESIIVYPTRIFGPGWIGKSNSIPLIIKKYIHGKWRFIPGNGSALGNYVYIDDVITGHILAYEKGKANQKYILSGTTVSYNDFFAAIKNATGKDYRLIHVPVTILNSIAQIMLWRTRLTGSEPLITKAFVSKALHNWNVSCQKAKNDLGYKPTPFHEALDKTVSWLLDTQANTPDKSITPEE